ncbi:Rdx family protein [Haloarculaceae archaeon H-GB2-1]|nr:Rdx family protein [Haloarculaceae archaeon H-GB1-1]MEA5387288.1 Rdx family protein [Haloarculaceae archaeon H-GB11]MEA5408754.1 Rdx family protein [Haloarculaceae archaeon H-GB2-1]
MARVEIEYCVPCGYRNRALQVAEGVLAGLETELDECRLTMGDHGVFVVRLDDEVVFDVSEDEFDVDAIVRTVRRAL